MVLALQMIDIVVIMVDLVEAREVSNQEQEMKKLHQEPQDKVMLVGSLMDYLVMDILEQVEVEEVQDLRVLIMDPHQIQLLWDLVDLDQHLI